MDAPEFKRWFAGSPLERTRRRRLHRNVAIALGNSGEERFLPRLEEWSASEDEVLAESAQWAVKRIRRSKAEVV
jgi:epoxyqueuosine reductase